LLAGLGAKDGPPCHIVNCCLLSEGGEWEEVVGWDAAQGCDCLSVSGSMELAATGGQGSELLVWDLETQERSFVAKGAKKDFLGLQVRQNASS